LTTVAASFPAFRKLRQANFNRHGIA
jgi:hypothetical protein